MRRDGEVVPAVILLLRSSPSAAIPTDFVNTHTWSNVVGIPMFYAARLRADLMRGAARVGTGGGGANCSFGAVRVAYEHDTAKQIRARSGVVDGVVGFAGCAIAAWLCVFCVVMLCVFSMLPVLLLLIYVLVAYRVGLVLAERLVRAAVVHQQCGMCSSSGLCCVTACVA